MTLQKIFKSYFEIDDMNKKNIEKIIQAGQKAQRELKVTNLCL